MYRPRTPVSAAPPNFRTLDLNLLRVFDAVMAEGSLTRAASALAMTQPAVSHALRRLRTALSDDLFVRTSHGMAPTPRAAWLWPQVRSALGSLRQAIAPGEFDPQRDAVQLRIAMADATAALLAPGLVAAIEHEQARANFHVLPLATRDPRPLLEAGEADLAVGHFPEAIPAIAALGQDATMRHRRIDTMRYVCVMRRDHPLAGSPFTLDDYCAAHHLLVSFTGRPHGAVDEILAGLGRRRRIVLTVNQFFTAARVVARSNLLTVLPDGFVEATGFGAEVTTRELPLALPPVNVEMVWHLRDDAAPAHRWLRERVIAAAQSARAPAPAPA